MPYLRKIHTENASSTAAATAFLHSILRVWLTYDGKIAVVSSKWNPRWFYLSKRERRAFIRRWQSRCSCKWLVNAVGHTLLADYLPDPLLGLVGVSSAIEPLAAVFKIRNAAHRREKLWRNGNRRSSRTRQPNTDWTLNSEHTALKRLMNDFF